MPPKKNKKKADNEEPSIHRNSTRATKGNLPPHFNDYVMEGGNGHSDFSSTPLPGHLFMNNDEFDVSTFSNTDDTIINPQKPHENGSESQDNAVDSVSMNNIMKQLSLVMNAVQINNANMQQVVERLDKNDRQLDEVRNSIRSPSELNHIQSSERAPLQSSENQFDIQQQQTVSRHVVASQLQQPAVINDPLSTHSESVSKHNNVPLPYQNVAKITMPNQNSMPQPTAPPMQFTPFTHVPMPMFLPPHMFQMPLQLPSHMPSVPWQPTSNVRSAPAKTPSNMCSVPTQNIESTCSMPMQSSSPSRSELPTHSSTPPNVCSVPLKNPASSIYMPKSNVNDNNVNVMPIVRRKLHDLPAFSGVPEEWPMFESTFNETTTVYGYTNLENLMRLQKCLHGKAKQIVEAMLVFPNNVPTIMEELKFRFGRTDLMIRSQLDKIKKIARIAEDNYTQLIEYSSKIRNFVAFIEAANAEYHLNNTQLVDELVAKLPNARRIEWAYYIGQSNSHDNSVTTFSKWLHEVAKITSIIENTGTSRYVGESIKSTANNKKYTLHAADVKPKEVKCNYCSEMHVISSCPKFGDLEVDDRWNWVKQKNICFSCLNIGHRVSDCRSRKKCAINNCNMRHHKLLHEIRVVTENKTKNDNVTDGSVLNVHQAQENIYFKVAAVTVFGLNGKKVSTFAIIDDASSMTLIESSLANELCLETNQSEAINLSWLDNTSVKRRAKIVNCQIQGRSFGCEILDLKKAHVMDDLSLPCQSIKMQDLTKQYPQLSGLPLRGYQNAKPRILIGLNNARLGYVLSFVDCESDGPLAVQTPLGWLVYGKNDKLLPDVETNKHVLLIHDSQREEYEELHSVVTSFYDTENYGVVKPDKIIESVEVTRARNILESTIKQTGSQYEIGLLWCADDIVLPESFNMAMKRLKLLEKKMSRDPVYADGYKRALYDFVDKKYARKLTIAEIEAQHDRTWYLPHFGVQNPNKPNKIRIVFDAAAITSKVSLNSQLLKGPDLGQPLIAVLSQFREHAVGVCADIKEMFCQVKIIEDDRKSQRFFWRENEVVQVFEMQSMIFGATCSPTAAQFIKNTHAEKFRNQFPDAVEAITMNHYVDDFVKCFQNEDDAINVSRQVVNIHAAAGFELRGFVSNSQRVTTALNKESTQTKLLTNLNVECGIHTEKVLGMYWNNDTDEFVFDLKFYKLSKAVLNQERRPTKREMLSLTMSIFDPFGFLGNFHVYAKILIQLTWKLPIDWDENVPEEMSKRWYQWQSELSKVKDFKIPRCYSIELSQAIDIQLHILVDASQEAFAAVSYWRIQLPNGVHLAFVYGKTRVAPRKMLSIPRMELQAAILGVRMKESILNNHNIKPSKCFLWTDSKTVLLWINSDSRDYKPFVSHRVSEILENSQASEWRWVPTQQNVADDATRAQFPVKFECNSRWTNGPEFLFQDSDQWPVTKECGDHEIDEELRRKKFVLVVSSVEPLMPSFNRFSKYIRLLRSTAWMHRVVNNCLAKKRGKPKTTGELSADELNQAEKYICRVVQETEFSDEYATLQKGLSIESTSVIYQLSPYLHDDGLIRVNGRIDAANIIPFQTRRPIILPKQHELTKLIIADHHVKCRHQFDETVICQVRQKFWIPCIRTVLRKVKSDCHQCKLQRVKPLQPMMGQLPFDRLAAFVRPFTFSGLDYFGPYYITVGRSKVKRWVALFTCSTYRAIHVEVAYDLSTDACILCLRNFINLRGIPKRIRSDNGTNFVGLKGELCNVDDFLDHDRIKSELAPFGIEWIFNCPADPSAGGSWERLVQSIKRALTSTLQNRTLHDHTFRSLLYEAMNIVNSRPLTHVPISPEDEMPLTPNHFLIGETNSTHMPGICNEKLMCLRKQWRIAQQLKNQFYTRWVKEYLPVLTRRCKWFKEVPPLKPGEIVLVCDTDQPRSKWIMGKIEEVVVANDGQVRQALIKTSSGLLRRPAHKLAVLDLEVKSMNLHGGGNVANSTNNTTVADVNVP